MRTKTLLFAGAALAFGLATSQAQVYSANVVGYTTVVLPAGPSYTLLASPVDDGQGNLGTNWLDPQGTLPNKTSIATWNGLTFNSIAKASGAWGFAAATTTIPPGSGFFRFFACDSNSSHYKHICWHRHCSLWRKHHQYDSHWLFALGQPDSFQSRTDFQPQFESRSSFDG